MSQIILPLLLLPGFLCTDIFWTSTCVYAKTKNIRTQCIKLNASTLDDMANLVLAQAPEHFSLAGFSMGAVVASRIAILAPERVGKLILLSMNQSGLLKSVRKNFESLQKEIKVRNYLQAIRGMGQHYVHQDSPANFIEWYDAMTASANLTIALRQLNMLLTMKSEGFDKIRCPTLVIAGTHDVRTTPAQQRALAQEIPNSTYVEIPKAGHFSLIDQPELVNQEILRFII